MAAGRPAGGRGARAEGASFPPRVGIRPEGPAQGPNGHRPGGCGVGVPGGTCAKVGLRGGGLGLGAVPGEVGGGVGGWEGWGA